MNDFLLVYTDNLDFLAEEDFLDAVYCVKESCNNSFEIRRGRHDKTWEISGYFSEEASQELDAIFAEYEVEVA